MKITRYFLIGLTLTTFLFQSCEKRSIPKPKAYFRIDFPSKSYIKFNNKYPFSFEYPAYSTIETDSSEYSEPYWLNIVFKKYNAKIHISYKEVKNNLAILTEDSREFSYKHSIKATAINEQIFVNENRHVYGTIYEIKGNIASPFQFHLTDSLNHFLRGSFYISEVPNYDSLYPVIKFIENDMLHLIESFSWN